MKGNWIRIILHLALFRPLLYLIFGVNVIGRENLARKGPMILFSNHNSHLDVFLLYFILPLHLIGRTHPVAALDYFRKPAWLFKFVGFLFRPVWLDRDKPRHTALRDIQARLNEERSIILFPEGSRGEPGSIQDFHPGIGFIAKENPGIPVIPVYLEGPERAFPKNTKFPMPLWNHVTIGPPQAVSGDSREIALRLHDHLKMLADEESEYRQHRLLVKQKPWSLSVIGLDGSGKSTLSRRLAEKFMGDTCFLGDKIEFFQNGRPRDIQPLLTDKIRIWMGNKAKSANNLKDYKIPKMTELLLRDRLLDEIGRWYRPERIVMDGSPLLNMTAWAVLYHERFFNESMCSAVLDILTGKRILRGNDLLLKELPELKTMRRFSLNHLHLPDIVVFLDVDTEICMQRIRKRGGSVQAHENPEKLKKLSNAYRLLCGVLGKSHPVFRLSGDIEIGQLVERTLEFLKSEPVIQKGSGGFPEPALK